MLGLVIGIATFLIIGLFHPVVVKAEYYWGTGCWWIFLVLGIGGIAWSLLTDNVLIAALAGVFAFSSFWTIKEVFEQEERCGRTRSAEAAFRIEDGARSDVFDRNGHQPIVVVIETFDVSMAVVVAP